VAVCPHADFALEGGALPGHSRPSSSAPSGILASRPVFV
jgi:hypothetical protein